MRVLQVSKFYPPVMGGIESVAWELTEGLNRAGVRTDVLCSYHRSRGVIEVLPSGYEVRRVGTWGQWQSTSIAPTMPWHLRRMAGRCQIVHVHMPDPMAAMAYWIVRPECRLVVHWHSDVVRQRLAYRVYAPLQDWLLARADAIVATSPPYAEHSEPLARWRDKVTVVPIGISDNRSENSARAQALRARFGGRRLVFALGRMTYYKGFDVLIEAAAALPADCAVMIGGDGELLSHFDAVIRRRGLANRVYLLGHVPDHDLNAYFEACDVFCMPSTARSEAYGVAIVEAMVMGKPIVATDLRGSGVPWVNRHMETGLNVPVGDPAALAAGLSQLLDDEPLRRRLGAAARRRYESDFGAERMTSLTLDLYRRLVPPPTA